MFSYDFFYSKQTFEFTVCNYNVIYPYKYSKLYFKFLSFHHSKPNVTITAVLNIDRNTAKPFLLFIVGIR